MTCIVAVRARRGIVLGADSAGVSGWRLDTRKDPKVFVRGDFAMGFTTSFRMGQLLHHAFVPPKLPKKAADLSRFMVVDFVDALRSLFKDRGFATTKEGQESGGCFLVGVRQHLFRIGSDYQVAENVCGYDAVGCGEEPAMGALFASEGRPAQERALLALKAAEKFNAGVRGPFRFVCQP